MNELVHEGTGPQFVTRSLKIILCFIIGVFSFLLYFNSIHHDFALDDHPAIDQNKITTSGIAGIPTLLKTDYWYGYHDAYRGPVYRPVTLIVFAVIWEFFPGDPHAYHAVNILLYAITCILLFLVLYRLFSRYDIIFPFIATLLFAAHPIHTEVVNNIKSLDEILCFLFGIIALGLLLKYVTRRSVTALVCGGVAYFVALLSKETGITFLVVIPLAIYFFTSASIRRSFAVAGMLLGITGIYLLLRNIVLEGTPTGSENVLNNALYAAPDVAARFATVFYILLRYMGLLFFPHPLSSDYGFDQVKIHSWGDPLVLLSLLLMAGFSILSVYFMRKKNIPAFVVLLFVITLAPVSNIFFIGGTAMAERFLYIPSLGFCIFLAYVLLRITRSGEIKRSYGNFLQLLSGNSVLLACISGVLILYSIKTVSRSKDWKDNLTLMARDVRTSENSATAHKIYGSSLYNSVRTSGDARQRAVALQSAKYHLKRALEIYPDYRDPLTLLGIIYYAEQNFDSAYYYQEREIKLDAYGLDINYNIGKTLIQLKQYHEAIRVSKLVLTLSPKHEGAFFNLALAHMEAGDMFGGELYFSKLLELNPRRGDAFYLLAKIMEQKGEYDKAKEYFNSAASLGYLER